MIITQSLPAQSLKIPSCLACCFCHLHQFKIRLPLMAVFSFFFSPLRARNDSNHPPLIPFPLCRLCKLSASFPLCSSSSPLIEVITASFCFYLYTPLLTLASVPPPNFCYLALLLMAGGCIDPLPSFNLVLYV